MKNKIGVEANWLMFYQFIVQQESRGGVGQFLAKK